MIWIIGFLTVLLVLDCLLLILLVLVQLPKKEAGLGQAFGGAATDALFGAGSGNALTKMTKYATVFFLLLTMGLSILNAQQSKANRTRFERAVQSQAQPAPVLPPVTPMAPVTTNAINTNAAAAPTNAPAPANTTPAP